METLALECGSEIVPVRRPVPFGDNREVTGTLASIDHRTPSLLQRKKCGGRFILHVFEGPGYGLHVEMNLRPP